MRLFKKSAGFTALVAVSLMFLTGCGQSEEEEYAAKVEQKNAELAKEFPKTINGITVEKSYIRDNIFYNVYSIDKELIQNVMNNDISPEAFFTELEKSYNDPSVRNGACKNFHVVKINFPKLQKMNLSYTFKDVTRTYIINCD